jgi:glycosyltransferase involved in cell wall biosynthesis
MTPLRAGTMMENSVVHVLFLAEDFPQTRLAAGGLRVSIRKQADGLAERGPVTVVVMRPLLPPLPRYVRSRVLEFEREALATRAAGDEREAENQRGVPAERGPHVLEYRYLHLPVLWRLTEPLQILLLSLWAFLRHARGARILHGHTAHLMGVPTILLGRLIRRSTVITVYGLDVPRAADGAMSFQQRMGRLALRRADRVVAVSHELARACRDLQVDDRRQRHVPSGVELERFAPPADLHQLRNRLGVPTDAFVFLSTNLFTAVKDHATLVEAFRRLQARHPRSYLVMTGDGILRRDIEAQVHAAGLDDRVRFTGFIAYDDIPQWVAACDVMVLPSLSEGMPLCILEGFACGKPTVGSNVGGIPQLVSDERYGLLVPPADPEALAGAMAQAIERRWDVEALLARAREFAWPAIIDQLQAVYEELDADQSLRST